MMDEMRLEAMVPTVQYESLFDEASKYRPEIQFRLYWYAKALEKIIEQKSERILSLEDRVTDLGEQLRLAVASAIS